MQPCRLMQLPSSATPCSQSVANACKHAALMQTTSTAARWQQTRACLVLLVALHRRQHLRLLLAFEQVGTLHHLRWRRACVHMRQRTAVPVRECSSVDACDSGPISRPTFMHHP